MNKLLLSILFSLGASSMCMASSSVAYKESSNDDSTNNASTPYYYKYRIYLKDKKHSEYSIHHPEAFLSERAIERRKRQGIKVDKTDLPVNSAYLKQIKEQGVDLFVTSKWNNTVVVGTYDTTLIAKVESLPCVQKTRKIALYKSFKQGVRNDSIKNVVSSINPTITSDTYNNAYTQINQLNGIPLHDAGFKGAGMVIAVIDGGFYNADILKGFANTKILGHHDFVSGKGDVFAEDTHGTMVLSCIGANIPGWQVGTAPEASFWLFRSEDSYSEQMVEEDNWCAAVEFADSVGADVLNASLGYTDYDADIPENKVEYSHLDGKTHLNSISASMIASKGMILCNSAGNSGDEEWKKIGLPADASDILAVGAIDATGKNTNFSSIGNSADGRIKPDVCAMGGRAAVYSPAGTLSHANGTSFSSPILTGMVACLWQALPNLTAYQIMDIIRKSGDRADCPDNIFGYGIPDFYKAYTLGLLYNK